MAVTVNYFQSFERRMVLKQMLDLPPEGCDFIPGELEEGRKEGGKGERWRKGGLRTEAAKAWCNYVRG